MADGSTQLSQPLRQRDKRQRQQVVTLRMDDAELAALREAAERAGLSVGAYIRAATLGDAGVRAGRRPVPERALLAQVLGQLGRWGNNLNQLAHQANTGHVPYPVHELAMVLVQFQELRGLILDAMGRADHESPLGRRSRRLRRGGGEGGAPSIGP